MTKKLLFGIFAHPDDEAFGPAGTLLLESQAGTEIHLITLTDGNAGANPDDTPDLGATRLTEWQAAGKLMNVSSMHHLGFTDGELNNIVMQDAAQQIEQIIRNELQSHTEPIEVDLMSLDPNGLTGHIDHIVASRAAHFVFYKLKREGLPLTRLRLYCLPRAEAPKPSIGWIYQDAGRSDVEIGQTVNISDVADEVRMIIRAHHSQRADGAVRLQQLDHGWRHDHFLCRP